jgi:transcriptional regulator with XRE-family HTH domain
MEVSSSMKNLRKRRESKKLSRWQLSVLSGVSIETIAGIELNGTNTGVENAVKLATALGTTVEDLMGKGTRTARTP